jgi:hypothetical protein
MWRKTQTGERDSHKKRHDFIRENAQKLRSRLDPTISKSDEYAELRTRGSLAHFNLKPCLLLAYWKINHQIRVRAHFRGPLQTMVNLATG